jgi:hypothetical protein
MNLTTFKLLVSLITLFSLGAGSGFVVARRTAPPASVRWTMPPVPAPSLRAPLSSRALARWSEARMAEYRQLLDLNPAQDVAMRGHFAALAADYETLRTEVRKRVAESLSRANTAIARELTPEQRRLFWQHLRENARRVEP